MATHHKKKRIEDLVRQIAELNALLEGENLGKMLKNIKKQREKGMTEEELMSDAEHAIKVIEAHTDLAIAKAKLSALQGEDK